MAINKRKMNVNNTFSREKVQIQKMYKDRRNMKMSNYRFILVKIYYKVRLWAK